MLFGYPRAAAADNNWLHECLVEMVLDAHLRALRREEPRSWPDVLPEKWRADLSSRTSLRAEFGKYQDAISRLSESEHVQVVRALFVQNRISDLVAGRLDCDRVADLPAAVRKPSLDLFTCAFKLLTPLRLREIQYRVIHASMAAKVCPFCGCEFFRAPGAPQEELDHYLARSVYPFAAANLLNLVPMGNACNTKFKGAIDMLRDGKQPRVAFDPYGEGPFVTISLDNSMPPLDDRVPVWIIDFAPGSQTAETWDQVFDVRRRYARDVLSFEYNSWLNVFCEFCRKNVPVDEVSLIAALNDYHEVCLVKGHSGFLEAAVFHMLWVRCSNDDQSLIAFLLELLKFHVVS